MILQILFFLSDKQRFLSMQHGSILSLVLIKENVLRTVEVPVVLIPMPLRGEAPAMSKMASFKKPPANGYASALLLQGSIPKFKCNLDLLMADNPAHAAACCQTPHTLPGQGKRIISPGQIKALDHYYHE